MGCNVSLHVTSGWIPIIGCNVSLHVTSGWILLWAAMWAFMLRVAESYYGLQSELSNKIFSDKNHLNFSWLNFTFFDNSNFLTLNFLILCPINVDLALCLVFTNYNNTTVCSIFIKFNSYSIATKYAGTYNCKQKSCFEMFFDPI